MASQQFYNPKRNRNKSGEVYDEEAVHPLTGPAGSDSSARVSQGAQGTIDNIDDVLRDQEQLAGQPHSAADESDDTAAAESAAGGGKSKDAEEKNDAEGGAGALAGAASLATAGTPLGAGGKLFQALLGTRRKKAAASGGAAMTIVGVLFFAFTIVQGPLEFIHASELLSSFHFASQDDFGDYRSSRMMLYILAGKAHKGRLGKMANKYADTWEKRLNSESGLKSIYSPGTKRLIGYEIIDENKANSFVSDTQQDGVPQSTSMTGVDSDGKAFTKKSGKFIDLRGQNTRLKRSVTRTAVKSIHVDKVSTTIATRLLKKRADVDLHPLKYVKRAASDKYDDWKKKQLEEHETTLENGSSGTESPLKAKIKEISDKLATILEKSQGPLAVANAVCAVKSFNTSVDARNLDNQQELERMGMDVVSMGDQVKYSRQSFDGEQLGVFKSRFDDAKTNTSFFDDPGIQSEVGQTMTGVDYLAKEGIKPTSEGLPLVFKLVAHFPTGLGPLDICVAFDKVGEVSDAIGLSGLITAGENLALKPFGVTTADLMNMAVDYFASGGVVTNATGSLLGGEANIGTRLAANDQFMASGGRKLTDTEAAQVKTTVAMEEKQEFAQESVYDKYFNVEDARSVAGTLFDQTPKTGGQLVASLANLPSTFSSMAATMFGGGRASADVGYDYGFPLWGYSEAEKNDPTYDNPYDNEDYMLAPDPQADPAVTPVPTRLDRMDADYGNDCFNMTVSDDGNITYGQSGDFHKIPDKCSDTSNTELTHFRFYLSDIITALSLSCYEGDEDACQQMGAASTPALSAAGDKIIAQFNTVNADIHMSDIHKLVSCGSDQDCIDKLSGYQAQAILGQAGTPPFDLVSTEETSPRQFRKILSLLPGYAGYPDTPAEINKMVQCDQGATAVFWNTAKFQKVGAGKTEEINNVTSICPKHIQAPWVELQDSGGNKFFVLTIHWPNGHYGGTDATLQEGVNLTMPWVNAHKSEGIVILNGDFNDHPEQKNTYCWLTQGGVLQNAYDFAKGSDPSKPCPSATGNQPGFFGRSDNMYITPRDDLVGSGWTHTTKSNPIMAHVSDFHTPIYYKLGIAGEEDAADVTGAWTWPISKADYRPISQCFKNPGHTGIDIPVPVGTPVLAARAGTVVAIDPAGGSDGGKYIIIKHGDALFTNYQHNSQILVTVNQQVTAGQKIALSGNTGFTTGPHSHFSVTSKQGLDSRSVVAYSMDPLKYLPVIPGRDLGGCQ